MDKNLKKIGRKMSLFMGITLSFFLSLLGNLTSGHFTFLGFLMGFVISTIISLVIGFIVPMKKITDRVCEKWKLQPGKFKTRCVESFISDLIYTPVITVVMVLMAYRQATAHGAVIPLAPMLLKSLGISMVAGFILIFFFMPFYLKLIVGNVHKEGRED